METTVATDAGKRVISVGDSIATLHVSMEKAPLWFTEYNVRCSEPLRPGDIQLIGLHGGNGWRKVFNPYAKLCFALNFNGVQRYETWQGYRDRQLLQADSRTALHCNPVTVNADGQTLNIVMGKSFADKLALAGQGIWLTPHIALCRDAPCFITPYFDYRQLTNARLDTLVVLIREYCSQWHRNNCE